MADSSKAAAAAISVAAAIGPPPPITVVVTPQTQSITINDSQQFSATVQNDGQNAGVQIWDVAAIASGTILEIPANADDTGVNGSLKEDVRHTLSSYTLLNPTTDDTTVPDGGSTIALLGFALVGVAQLRRRIVKA